MVKTTFYVHRVEENENSEDAVSNDSTEDIKPFQRPSIIVSPKSKREIMIKIIYKCDFLYRSHATTH